MGNYVAAQRYPYGNYVITPTIPKCEQKLLSGDRHCKWDKNKKGRHIVTAFLTKSLMDYFFFFAAFLAGFLAFLADFFAVFAIAFNV